MDDAERARQGMTVRRAVLGDEHVDRAVATTTSFTAPFQDFITRYAWGETPGTAERRGPRNAGDRGTPGTAERRGPRDAG
jgi:hypothetical protein